MTDVIDMSSGRLTCDVCRNRPVTELRQHHMQARLGADGRQGHCWQGLESWGDRGAE
ncbi:hypothetical protein [Streptomyces sp. 8N616]|uniref:hypothetical protein n=1 Tax=Streptomyces sp. 8N616 TaxID=3457414 RepID=UPI003FCFC58A